MSERNGWKAILTLLFLVQHKLLFTVLKLWHCGALNWKKNYDQNDQQLGMAAMNK